jgi:hypothetical protein
MKKINQPRGAGYLQIPEILCFVLGLKNDEHHTHNHPNQNYTIRLTHVLVCILQAKKRELTSAILGRCDTSKVSNLHTIPLSSRNPQTICLMPTKKLCPHHLMSLNLEQSECH